MQALHPTPTVPVPSSVPQPCGVAALQEQGCLWRGDALGGAAGRVLATGHAALDRELPGGGWPCQALTEVLLPAGAGCEWRLLGPMLRHLATREGTSLLIGAPALPHVPALQLAGLDPARLVWVAPDTPTHALWAAEQALRCRQAAAVMLWLPKARPQALRRLQAHAQQADMPLFVFRPQEAQQESSPAPLRLWVAPARPWSLQVRLLKRRGPTHEGVLELPALPPRMAGVLAAKLRHAAAPAVPAASGPSVETQEHSNAVLAGPDHALMPVAV